MKRAILTSLLALALAAPAAATTSFPLRSATGAAAVWQKHIDTSWDPAGRCRALNGYSFRCVSVTGGHRFDQVFSKAGLHRVRLSTSADYGPPLVRVIPITSRSVLYPFI